MFNHCKNYYPNSNQKKVNKPNHAQASLASDSGCALARVGNVRVIDKMINKLEELYSTPWVLAAYFVAGLSILSGYFQNYLGLTLGLLFLLIWDVTFSLTKSSFQGRGNNATNDSVTRARTYISWYIGVYGIVIGLALTKTNELGKFSFALEFSSIPAWLIALPMGLSILSMLFIPIRLDIERKESEGEEAPPNCAQRSLFFFVVYSQKVILILIGHIGLRIMSGWS